MTDNEPSVADVSIQSPSSVVVAAAHNAHPPRGFVLWLSAAQLTSWGTLFYLFSLLLEHFERDLSPTRVDAALAFSIALLMEGVLGVRVGRLIDVGRARVVMCAGSLLAGVGFATMSLGSGAVAALRGVGALRYRHVRHAVPARVFRLDTPLSSGFSPRHHHAHVSWRSRQHGVHPARRMTHQRVWLAQRRRCVRCAACVDMPAHPRVLAAR